MISWIRKLLCWHRWKRDDEFRQCIKCGQRQMYCWWSDIDGDYGGKDWFNISEKKYQEVKV